jgi:Ni/Co efflux regulator RcnB
MRKMLITLALVAAPVFAAAQQQPQDTTKAKPKTPPAHHAATTKPKPKTPADTSKGKATTMAPTDTTKKPH